MTEVTQQNSEAQNPHLLGQQQIDIIKYTRSLVKNMTQQQRFIKAHSHLNDALANRAPRPGAYQLYSSKLYNTIYIIQTSYLWSSFMFFLSYALMYLVMLNDHQQTFSIIIIVETIILTIFWIDSALQIYHRCTEMSIVSQKLQRRFYVKQVILILLTIDLIIYACTTHLDRLVRPFRILRGVLPIFYDNFIRKAFAAMLTSYKDLIVFVFFDTLVILSTALIASQVIQIPEGVKYDQFTQNYGAFGKTIFVIYALSSYDLYPDNQLVAIRASIYYYAFFIVFIFFNVFFFTVVPITIIFTSFRNVRGKILLIDQIKQQHSLILCFVSLGGQQNLNISAKKMTDFLLYVYKNKVRYIDYIASICLKLDRNNNGEVQVSQFMQLCKILQANSSMLPPTFHDIQIWLKIHAWINQKFQLKEIIFSEKFKIITSIIIILTFLNSSLAIVTELDVFDIIDNFLVAIYVFEVMLKIVGLGPELYLTDKWNKLDLILVNIAVFFNMAPMTLLPTNTDVLFKMLRIFRIATLISIIFGKKKILIYTKIQRLLGQTAIIIPVVIKFFPLYLITAYMFGIIGMEIFHGEPAIPSQESPYSQYDQFSNFRTFLYSQFLMIQVVVQAGWCQIAYDHAYKFGYYGFVLAFFVILHIANVLILASLLKGIVWEVYRTVDEQYDRRARIDDSKENLRRSAIKKEEQMQCIKQKMQHQFVQLDSLIKKQLYERRVDLLILKRFKKLNQQQQSIRKTDKTEQEWGISRMNTEEVQASNECQLQSGTQLAFNQLNQKNRKYSNESQMERIINKIVISQNVKSSQVIVYPHCFTQYLNNKMVSLSQLNQGKDKNAQIQTSQKLFFQLNLLLGIKKSKKDQKNIIIQNMVNEELLSVQDSSKQAVRLRKTKQSVGVDWVMKKTFLGQNNEDLIRKFQVEYFSDIYGQSFKEINKITLEPLLRYEATLTYCLRNLLRYPKINEIQFFRILTHIQNNISDKLLKKGSLFKFIYQIDFKSDSWFSIKVRQDKSIGIRFIKSAVWALTKQMKQKQIYYGQDIFKWDVFDRKDRSLSEYIKLFYKSFQSLACTSDHQEPFFQSNPDDDIYDLFHFFLDVSADNWANRNLQELKISKIMVVILSREQQRKNEDKLPLPITQFKHQSIKKNQFKGFKFSDTQNETFEKLKSLSVSDHQKIVQTEGMPLIFIINLMQQLMETLQLNIKDLIANVQKVLNKEYSQVKENNQFQSKRELRG